MENKNTYESVIGALKKEIDDFFNTSIKIAGNGKNNPLKDGFLSGKNSGGYDFNQYQMLDLDDLYLNSKFETGEKDSEGQDKLFLNVVKFRKDVARSQTDIDVKDHLFIPEDGYSVYGAYFMNKEFKQWSKVSEYGAVINELNDDRNKYGTCVGKRIKDEIHRLPLKSLINPQDAKTLKEAFSNGQSIIEVHEMTWFELMKYKERGWQVDDIEYFVGKKKVYERYGLAGQEELARNRIVISEPMALTLSIIMLDEIRENKKKTEISQLLYINLFNENEFPYEESHKNKIDGRWLGVGEVELQIPNQIARNMITNLRKRSMQWAARYIFQSRSNEIAKNLIRDVKDGDVLYIGANGEITQVNKASQGVNDFQTSAQEWEQNSDQKAFSFEVATGESMGSGTPFRLGVILSNAVNSHFGLEREEFGFFVKRVMNNLIIPIFKKQWGNEEHIYNVMGDDEDIEDLRFIYTEAKVREAVLAEVNRGLGFVDVLGIKEKIKRVVDGMRALPFRIPKAFYDSLKYSVRLIVTGESVNMEKKIETGTNLLNLVAQNPAILQDPSLRKLMSKILSWTGENLTNLVGVPALANAMPMGMAQGQTGVQPTNNNNGGSMAAMMNVNAPENPNAGV